jgi:hypothetical protein
MLSEKKFEILRHFASELHGGFLNAHLERYQFDFKVGQKTQNLTGNFFYLTFVGFIEKKILENFGRDDKNFCHLVQPEQLFLDQG